jgi:hypothetical protein
METEDKMDEFVRARDNFVYEINKAIEPLMITLLDILLKIHQQGTKW